MQNNRKVVVISKRTLVLVVGAVALSVIAWYMMTVRKTSRFLDTRQYGDGGIGLMNAESSTNISAPSLPKSKPVIIGNEPGTSVSDTREFLKTYYRAIVQTRNVPGVVGSVKNIVKGNDGRIDNISSSEKTGYVSFVIPKSKFETFQKEIEELVPRQLLSVTSSAQNLLEEKISIEEQQNNIESSLESLNQQKEQLLSQHNQVVAAINRELASTASELKRIRKEIESTTDQGSLEALRTQEATLVSKESTQKYKLAAENKNYGIQDASLTTQIQQQSENLTRVGLQDTKFNENIETVNGSVQVNWVSVWQLIQEYSPVHPVFLITLMVIIVWNVLTRFGLVPKFVVR